VLRELTLESAPLSQRQLHVKTGLPREVVGQAVAGLRNEGRVTALNTVIETFMLAKSRPEAR
jgi:hypothetical protein